MKKVLLIDDSESLHAYCHNELEDEIEIFDAYSKEEAEELFNSTPDLAAIVVDACVPGHEPNTQDLVEMFRKTFQGPIIAVSSSLEYRNVLVSAGCSHDCSKFDLLYKLLEILK